MVAKYTKLLRAVLGCPGARQQWFQSNGDVFQSVSRAPVTPHGALHWTVIRLFVGQFAHILQPPFGCAPRSLLRRPSRLLFPKLCYAQHPCWRVIPPRCQLDYLSSIAAWLGLAAVPPSLWFQCVPFATATVVPGVSAELCGAIFFFSTHKRFLTPHWSCRRRSQQRRPNICEQRAAEGRGRRVRHPRPNVCQG